MRLVDLVGIEPTTSSIPFLAAIWDGTIGRIASVLPGGRFMACFRAFTAFVVLPSGTARHARHRQGGEGHDTSHDTERALPFIPRPAFPAPRHPQLRRMV